MPPIRVNIGWLGLEWQSGAADRRQGGRRPAAPATSTPTPSNRRRSAAGTRGRAWRRVRAALTAPTFARRLVRLLFDLAHVLAPRAVSGWIQIGGADPAETGIVVALWHGVIQPLAWRPGRAWQLRLVLDFVRSVVRHFRRSDLGRAADRCPGAGDRVSAVPGHVTGWCDRHPDDLTGTR